MRLMAVPGINGHGFNAHGFQSKPDHVHPAGRRNKTKNHPGIVQLFQEKIGNGNNRHICQKRRQGSQSTLFAEDQEQTAPAEETSPFAEIPAPAEEGSGEENP